MSIFRTAVHGALMKGELFRMGKEVGLTDLSRLAEIGIKWNLSHKAATNLIVGTNNPDHLVKNLAVLNNLDLTEEDNGLIDRLKTSAGYTAYEDKKINEFFELDSPLSPNILILFTLAVLLLRSLFHEFARISRAIIYPADKFKKLPNPSLN